VSLILSLIIFILVAALVLWLVSYILGLLPIDPTLRNIVLALVALLILIAALQRFGVLGALGVN